MSMEEVVGVGMVSFGVMMIVFRRELAATGLSLAKRVFGAEPIVGLDTHLLAGGILMVIVGILALVSR